VLVFIKTGKVPSVMYEYEGLLVNCEAPAYIGGGGGGAASLGGGGGGASPTGGGGGGALPDGGGGGGAALPYPPGPVIQGA